jgi:hypothetical protein
MQQQWRAWIQGPKPLTRPYYYCPKKFRYNILQKMYTVIKVPEEIV